MRPANITRWRAYSLKNVSFLEPGLEIAIKMESSYYMCFQGLEKFEEQKMQLSSCLICRIRYMPEQQSKKHVCVFGCAFSVEHTPRPCRGVHFVSLLSLRVLTCFFFFVPSSALFGLSVTAVKHIPVWTAGGVHTLSISPPLRVHVSMCVNVRSRASTRRRVVVLYS